MFFSNKIFKKLKKISFFSFIFQEHTSSLEKVPLFKKKTNKNR